MKKLTIALSVLSVLILCARTNAQTTKSQYEIVRRIHLPETAWWDYPSLDAATGRLFVSRGTMVQVVNVKTGKLVATIPNTEGVHGIALAEDLNKGFISDGADSSVTVFNLKTLQVIGTIQVTGRDPDAILYDPFTHRVFTCNGRSGNSTVIDARTDKVIGTIKLSGSPEFSATDGQGRIYINIEDNSQVDEINPRTMKIENVWPLAPGEHPSGLAIDAKRHILFSTCHNKLMVVMNALNGKVMTTLPIGERVDGAAFDPVLRRAFSSNGQGTLTVVQEEGKDKFTVLEQFPTQLGARTITIDVKTHHLFLPTAEFNPPAAPTAEHPHPRPTMKPNSFTVLEVAPLK
ncbi:MAG: YncE family protein [Bacteroidetes bacterium]|nr:YncE family protein [Bacteroidota bacterium]